MTIDTKMTGIQGNGVDNLGRQGFRILVVDDEIEIRDVLRRYLKGLGYDVSTEECTHKAGDRILNNNEKYDCVLSDYNNKDASGDHHGGRTLYDRLREANANPPLYYWMSGDHNITVPEGIIFFKKPFNSLQELGEFLNSAFKEYQQQKDLQN